MTAPINGYGGPDTIMPPMTEKAHGRAMRIAAIHAFADFLADRPDVPMPQQLIGSYHVTPQDEADEWTRVAGVISVLQGLAVAPTEGERTVQGDLHVTDLRAHGISIIYRAAAHKDPTPPNRYITRQGQGT